MELERRTCGLDLVVVASIAGCAWVYKQGKEKYRKYKDKKAAAAEQAATDLTADARPASPTTDPPPPTDARPPTPEPNSLTSSLTLDPGSSPDHRIPSKASIPRIPSKASVLGLNNDDQAEPISNVQPISQLPANVKPARTRFNNRPGQPEQSQPGQPEQLSRQNRPHPLHPSWHSRPNAQLPPLRPNAQQLRANGQPRSDRYAL